jgi:hypothetical protein
MQARHHGTVATVPNRTTTPVPLSNSEGKAATTGQPLRCSDSVPGQSVRLLVTADGGVLKSQPRRAPKTRLNPSVSQKWLRATLAGIKGLGNRRIVVQATKREQSPRLIPTGRRGAYGSAVTRTRNRVALETMRAERSSGQQS